MGIPSTTKAQRPRLFMMNKKRQGQFFSSKTNKANNTAETLENNFFSNKHRLNQTVQQEPVVDKRGSQDSNSKHGSPYSTRKSSDKYRINSKDRIGKNPNVKFNYIPFD